MAALPAREERKKDLRAIFIKGLARTTLFGRDIYVIFHKAKPSYSYRYCGNMVAQFNGLAYTVPVPPHHLAHPS